MVRVGRDQGSGMKFMGGVTRWPRAVALGSDKKLVG